GRHQEPGGPFPAHGGHRGRHDPGRRPRHPHPRRPRPAGPGPRGAASNARAARGRPRRCPDRAMTMASLRPQRTLTHVHTGGSGHRPRHSVERRSRSGKKERSMRHATIGFITAVVLALTATAASAAGFQMTPAVQAELDKQKTVIAGWAANATVVNAVVEQNRRGPIAGMDNPKWRLTRRSDPTMTAFQSNAAGQFLKAQIDENKGKFSEAFLSAAAGEKVAFVEKTTSYIHVGQAKFDAPYTTGKAWQ